MVAELVSTIADERRQRLSPFVVGGRFVWLDAPAANETTDIEGFSAEVRISLTNAELREFQQALVDVDGRRVDANALLLIEMQGLQNERTEILSDENTRSTAQRTKDLERNREKIGVLRKKRQEREDALQRELYALAAPHIRDWNACTIGADGEPVKIDPPIIGGAASLEAVEDNAAVWVVNRICDAWRLGKSLTANSMPSKNTLALSQEPRGGPRIVEDV